MDSRILTSRIRLEAKSTVIDADYGTQTITWTPFATVRAQVQDVLPSRAESQAEGIRIAERPARIRFRYIAGVTSDMRVILVDRADRVMQIIAGPAEMGRREGIELVAENYSTSGAAP